MKNAHINSISSIRAGKWSLLRRLLACALIGSAAMSVAHAGPGRGQQQQEYSRDADPRQQPRQYDDRQQRQFDERAFQARADEQRRQMEQQQQQSNDGRRNSRLTPDERRDLRRQINEAGADIYSNKGRRR